MSLRPVWRWLLCFVHFANCTSSEDGGDEGLFSQMGLYQMPRLGQILQRTNGSGASPCDNFYAHVCAEVHRMPFQASFKDSGTHSAHVINHYDSANRRIDNQLFRSLRSYAHKSDFGRSQIARQMLVYYETCLDEKKRKKQRARAMELLASKMRALRGRNERVHLDARVLAELFPNLPFFSLQKWTDRHIAIQLSIGLFYGLWPVPNWERELRVFARKVLRAAREEMRQSGEEQVALWIGATKADIERRVRTLLQMERRFRNDDDQIEPNALNSKVTELGKLPRQFAHGMSIDWTGFFSAILPQQNFTEESEIVLIDVKLNGVQQRRSPMEFLSDYLQEYGDGGGQALRDYIDWTVIFQYAALSDSQIFDRIFKKHSRAANALMNSFSVKRYAMDKHANATYVRAGTAGEVNRAQARHNCLEQIKLFFPEYVDRLFASELNGALEEEAKTIMDWVKKGFGQVLEETSWLTDGEDREKAKVKLARMGRYIGTISAIGDPKDPLDGNLTQIDHRYAPFYQIKESQPFVDMAVALIRQSSLVGLANPVLFYPLRVHDVDGYNIYRFNAMMVSGGMMRRPFISKKHSVAENFGAMGTVIGHELGHSFDVYGYEYNESGEKDERWWSSGSKLLYAQRKDCFQEQYGAYQMSFEGDGLAVNGTRTLFENIADNAGVRAAFLGMRQRLEGMSRRERQADRERAHRALGPVADGLSDAQLFFTRYAYSWCGRMTREKMEKFVKKSVHSPREVRVNLALSNFPKFARAFGCAPGTGMNPEKRCTMWGDAMASRRARSV